MEKRKIRISSNAEGLTLNPLEPQEKEQEYKLVSSLGQVKA